MQWHDHIAPKNPSRNQIHDWLRISCSPTRLEGLAPSICGYRPGIGCAHAHPQREQRHAKVWSPLATTPTISCRRQRGQSGGWMRYRRRSGLRISRTGGSSSATSTSLSRSKSGGASYSEATPNSEQVTDQSSRPAVGTGYHDLAFPFGFAPAWLPVWGLQTIGRYWADGVEDHDDRRIPRDNSTPTSARTCTAVAQRDIYGRRRTCPGLILSGSVNWSLFSSKIFMYAPALPRCSLAIPLSVSPALTV